jgi:hypothetical protein
MARPRRIAAEALERRVCLDATPAGPAFPLDSADAPDFYHSRPAVAADSRGNFVAAWSRHLGDFGDGRRQWDVSARLFDSVGNPRGPEFLAAGGPGDQVTPAVAMDDDGDFVIAWVNHPGGVGRIPQPTIHVMRYSADGVPQGSELVLSAGATQGEVAPSVAMNAAGDFVVAWNAGFLAPAPLVGTRFYTFAQTVDRSGVRGQLVKANAPDTGSAQKYTAVGIDADGDFAVLWAGYGQRGLFARRFDASSVPREDPQLVSDAPDYYGPRAVAMDDDGDYVVAWALYDYGKVNFRRFDETSDAWSEPVVVDQISTRHSDYRPAVDMDSDGDFVVAWTAYDQPWGEIRARAYNRDGTPRGEKFVVATGKVSGLVFDPAVALDEDGDLLVAFGSYYYADPRLQIYARRYTGVTQPAAPHVAGAFAGSSRWIPRTSSLLQTAGLGDRAYGFDLSKLDRSMTLPWSNLDRITLTFNRATTVGPGDIIVRGTGGALYPVASFASDRASRSVTWALGRSLTAGRVTIELATAAGLNLLATFGVLPGDGNRDGRVDSADLSRVRSLASVEVGYDSTPPDALFYDVDGTGRIDARDAMVVRRNMGRSLELVGSIGSAPSRPPPLRRSALGLLGADPTLIV